MDSPLCQEWRPTSDGYRLMLGQLLRLDLIREPTGWSGEIAGATPLEAIPTRTSILEVERMLLAKAVDVLRQALTIKLTVQLGEADQDRIMDAQIMGIEDMAVRDLFPLLQTRLWTWQIDEEVTWLTVKPRLR